MLLCVVCCCVLCVFVVLCAVLCVVCCFVMCVVARCVLCAVCYHSLNRSLTHSPNPTQPNPTTDLNEELQHRLTTIQNNHNSAPSAWAPLTLTLTGKGKGKGGADTAVGGVSSGLGDGPSNSSSLDGLWGVFGSAVAAVLGLGLVVLCLLCCVQIVVRGGRGGAAGFSTPFFNRGRKEPVRTV